MGSFFDPTPSFTRFRQPREKVPLCEDLRPGVLLPGEKCWSKCGERGQEDCMTRVLMTPEEGEAEMVRHPACRSQVACPNGPHRVLCEARIKPDDDNVVSSCVADLTAIAVTAERSVSHGGHAGTSRHRPRD